MEKVSIRFYHDHEVRAVWSEEYDKWFFSLLDVLVAINDEDDYQKTRNYWKYLKGKLKKESSELVSATTQLKLRAADGKKYNTDVLDAHGVVLLAKSVSNHRATAFLDWLTWLRAISLFISEFQRYGDYAHMRSQFDVDSFSYHQFFLAQYGKDVSPKEE